MLIGAMNHPRHDPFQEMAWMAQVGLDFVDLTLEPPAAASWQVDPAALRAALAANGLEVVGHTPHYLPLASPIEELRRGAVEELRRCLRVFAAIGVRWMNVHPDGKAPLHDRDYVVHRNLQSLAELLPEAQRRNVGLMVENIPGSFNSVEQLADLLEPMPELGLHLDIGHCYLRTFAPTADALIRRYADRLQHVHLHDNKGGTADLHLPLGTGEVDYYQHARTLRDAGYDGTITLEVFSPDQRHFLTSCEMLREAWTV